MITFYKSYINDLIYLLFVTLLFTFKNEEINKKAPTTFQLFIKYPQQVLYHYKTFFTADTKYFMPLCKSQVSENENDESHLMLPIFILLQLLCCSL